MKEYTTLCSRSQSLIGGCHRTFSLPRSATPVERPALQCTASQLWAFLREDAFDSSSAASRQRLSRQLHAGWHVDKLLLRLRVCVRLVCGVGCTPTRSFLIPHTATTCSHCVEMTKLILEKGLTLQLSPNVVETPHGIVYAMTLSTTLEPYLP